MRACSRVHIHAEPECGGPVGSCDDVNSLDPTLFFPSLLIASKEQVLAAKGALQKRRSQEGLQPAAAAAGGAAATAASPEAMAAEVRDLQHEFEAERQIMLATIREHEQSIAWRAAPTTSTANPPPPPPLPPPPPRHCHHDCRRHRGLLLAR